MDEMERSINKEDGIRQVKQKLAFQCAPVLMGEKTANLLIIENFLSDSVDEVIKQIEEQGGKIHIFFLFRDRLRTVFFLYKKELLERYLGREENTSFLKNCGYRGIILEENLEILKERFVRFRQNKQDFPHELGIFLGYPLWDVKGFMVHQGKNCLYTGYWKVYDNLPQAKQIFKKYEECRSVLMKQLIYDMIS